MKTWLRYINGQITHLTTSDPALFPVSIDVLPVYNYHLEIPYENIDDLDYIKEQINLGNAELIEEGITWQMR